MHGGKPRLPKKRSRYSVVNRLTEIRVAKEMPRDDLAEVVGYHKMIIGRFERGETTPSLQTLVNWCEALGYELDLKAKDQS